MYFIYSGYLVKTGITFIKPCTEDYSLIIPDYILACTNAPSILLGFSNSCEIRKLVGTQSAGADNSKVAPTKVVTFLLLSELLMSFVFPPNSGATPHRVSSGATRHRVSSQISSWDNKIT